MIGGGPSDSPSCDEFNDGTAAGVAISFTTTAKIVRGPKTDLKNLVDLRGEPALGRGRDRARCSNKSNRLCHNDSTDFEASGCVTATVP